jgi:hypothetical protein
MHFGTCLYIALLLVALLSPSASATQDHVWEPMEPFRSKAVSCFLSYIIYYISHITL